MRSIPLCFAIATLPLALSALAAPALWGASNPFVGKWKIDVARSRIVDAMRVEALDGNRYAFSFEGAPTETVVADGTDQPGVQGTTLAVKSGGSGRLTVVRKSAGREVVSASWKLSANGRTLRDDFTSIQDDGARLTTHYLYRRTAGNSGFAGAWESTTPPNGLNLELEIQPFEEKGLRFVSPGSDKSVLFDGQDHAAAGTKDVMLSGRRFAGRSLEYTEKRNGKVQRVRRFALSPDGRTLTETIRVLRQATPDVFVFARE